MPSSQILRKDCNIPKKLCGKSDYNGVNQKKDEFIENALKNCKNLKKFKDIEPLWSNPKICKTNTGKSVAGNHKKSSIGKDKKKSGGKFGAPKSKTQQMSSKFKNSKSGVSIEMRLQEKQREEERIKREEEERIKREEEERIKRKEEERIKREEEESKLEEERRKLEEERRKLEEERRKNHERTEIFRVGFANKTVCWGGEVKKADGTKEILEGKYEVARSNDHIYKLLKKKEDGTYKYYQKKGGSIHISVHHATRSKPTKIHLKLGTRENTKIREFSSVERDGTISLPCKGHMYSNKSNKKLNRFENVCDILWENWVTEHSEKYLGSQTGSFRNNFAFVNNGKTSSIAPGTNVSVSNNEGGAGESASASAVPDATIDNNGSAAGDNSYEGTRTEEGIKLNSKAKPVAAYSIPGAAGSTPGVFNNAEEKNSIEEGLGSGNTENGKKIPVLGKISKKKSKSIKGKKCTKTSKAKKGSKTSKAKKGSKTNKAKKGSKTSKAKKGSKTSKAKKGSKTNKGSKNKKSSSKEVYNSWKDGSDVYKNTKGFYIIQYNPKKNLEYKKYLPNYSKTKKGKI